MTGTKTFIYELSSIGFTVDMLVKMYGFSTDKGIKCAIYGAMGSGKTTLTKNIIKALGSLDEGASPTFTLANQYKTQNNGIIYHMDLYRLNTLQDAFNAGIYEIIQSPHMCFVEWPELIEEWIDDSWYKLKLDTIDDKTRSLEIKLQTSND